MKDSFGKFNLLIRDLFDDSIFGSIEVDFLGDLRSVLCMWRRVRIRMRWPRKRNLSEGSSCLHKHGCIRQAPSYKQDVEENEEKR